MILLGNLVTRRVSEENAFTSSLTRRVTKHCWNFSVEKARAGGVLGAIGTIALHWLRGSANGGDFAWGFWNLALHWNRCDTVGFQIGGFDADFSKACDATAGLDGGGVKFCDDRPGGVMNFDFVIFHEPNRAVGSKLECSTDVESATNQNGIADFDIPVGLLVFKPTVEASANCGKPLRVSHRARKSGRMGCTEMHNPFSVKNIECVIDQGATARTEKATIASNQTQVAHFYSRFPIS